MPKITEMFAYVVEDKGPDDEGVMAMMLPNGVWAPMVGADVARAVLIKPMAEEIAKAAGKPYKCLHFKLVGELPMLEG